MTGTIGLLETTGLTPAMAAIDRMIKSASVQILQVELNDFYGVVVKLSGPTADVITAVQAGKQIAEEMGGAPIATVLTQVSSSAVPGINSRVEVSPLIQQQIVFNSSEQNVMSEQTPQALGFIETQGFTAVFEAIDTACKAAGVEVIAKEKLGGGYITVVIQGDLSAVSSAVAAGREKVNGLGKLIAGHVIARPSEPVMKLLQRL